MCIGLSVAGAFTPAMLERMARRPVVMALSNPVPEIMPDLAMRSRPDAVIATGRSDFPNQVTRGGVAYVLDVGGVTILRH